MKFKNCKKIVILTGSELRHEYFRKKLNMEKKIDVACTICESNIHSLEDRIFKNPTADDFLINHAKARLQTEKDFFQVTNQMLPEVKTKIDIKKGDINKKSIINKIDSYKPDLIVCYGSSIIDSELLEKYKFRFLNVHLGLSPYYRGSGTNVWPIINNEPFMIGATFMHIGKGIDNGEIIHQIRGDLILGDGPHSFGNRLIIKMVNVYIEIIKKFEKITKEPQPKINGNFYKRSDFNNKACKKLYAMISKNVVNNWAVNYNNKTIPDIVQNEGLKNL